MIPGCIGFAMDPTSKWCVWFDDVEPSSINTCSTTVKTEYVKKRPGPPNQDLWLAIQKVHVFEKAVQEVLVVADLKMNMANQNWLAMESNKTGNDTKQDDMQNNLFGSLRNYSNVAYDAHMLNRQLDINTEAAFAGVLSEIATRPPFHDTIPEIKTISDEEQKPVLTVKVGFQPPEDEAPKLVRWRDFPNSDDTEWSQLHPDCPMGVPCVCDCKCRGAPPQNFILPPPPPYKPPCEPSQPLDVMQAQGPALTEGYDAQMTAAKQFGYGKL
jgi:hypothetical protein